MRSKGAPRRCLKILAGPLRLCATGRLAYVNAHVNPAVALPASRVARPRVDAQVVIDLLPIRVEEVDFEPDDLARLPHELVQAHADGRVLPPQGLSAARAEERDALVALDAGGEALEDEVDEAVQAAARVVLHVDRVPDL